MLDKQEISTSRYACLHSQRWKSESPGCSGGGHWFTTLHAALGLRNFIEKTWPGYVPSLI